MKRAVHYKQGYKIVISGRFYEVSDGKIRKIIRSIIDECRGYRSYVVYKLIGDKYCDIERWTAKERKEVKNEN